MAAISSSTSRELEFSLRLRDYQYEMFERSEKGNVIVAVAQPHDPTSGQQLLTSSPDGYREWKDARVRMERRC